MRSGRGPFRTEAAVVPSSAGPLELRAPGNGVLAKIVSAFFVGVALLCGVALAQLLSLIAGYYLMFSA